MHFKAREVLRYTPVCNEWTLHKFRRTWATLHLRAGVSTYELQDWIGHSDQEMLKRYAKNAGAQSAQTWRKVNDTFSSMSFYVKVP